MVRRVLTLSSCAMTFGSIRLMLEWQNSGDEEPLGRILIRLTDSASFLLTNVVEVWFRNALRNTFNGFGRFINNNFRLMHDYVKFGNVGLGFLNANSKH